MTTGFYRKIAMAAAPTAAMVAYSLLMPSCASHNSSELDVDSLVYERSWTLKDAMENDPLGGRSHFYAKIDYPKQVDDPSRAELVDSVRAWLSRQLLPSEAPVLSQKVLDMAANVFFGETDGNEWGEEVSYSIRKVFEDSDYLTYEINKYAYSGGAHGGYNVNGVTFRKSDCTRVAWADFETGDELRKTVTEEIRKSKCMPNDDAFASSILINTKESHLADGTFALPLPAATPWLTAQGWVFTYQPYEILPWCHGAPACCIKELALKQ